MLAIALSVTGCSRKTSAAGVAGESASIQVGPERFQAKVLKVFFAKKGEAIFRAYVVNWNQQDVVVSDPLAMTDHHVGDTISVLAMDNPYPHGAEARRLLAFVVLPDGR